MSGKKFLLWGAPVALGVYFLLVYLLPLGMREMVRPDEFRYAEVPREMVATGDWVTPRLLGVRYFEKPALGYQLTAVCFKVFGENAFALRLPSALAVLLSALALYGLLRKNSPSALLPGVATGIYLNSALVFGVGTFAVLDSQLSAALTITVVAFFSACQAQRRVPILLWLLLAGAAAGAAFLLKGFLAFVIPAIVAAPWLLWQREWKKLLLYPWLPLAVALAICLPWSLAIHRAEPDFWRYFIEVEHWKRFTSGTLDRSAEPFWYFIPVLLVGMLPPGLLVAATRGGWSSKLLTDPLTRFLICWSVIPFLFFSISSCKLGTYILPCFPPLAGLLALALLTALARYRQRTMNILYFINTNFGRVLIVTAVAGVLLLLLRQYISILPPFYSAGARMAYLSAAAMVFWGALLVGSARRKWRLRGVLGSFLLGGAPLLCFGQGALPVELLGDKTPAVGLRAALAEIPVRPEDTVLVDRNTFHTAAWMLKRSDLIIIGRNGELEYGLTTFPDDYPGRWHQEKELPGVLGTRSAVGRRIYIINRNFKRRPLPPTLPVLESTQHGEITVVRF